VVASAVVDLGGTWRAALSRQSLQRTFADPAAGEEGWEDVVIPGHWRNHPAFAGSDGPLLYRCRFHAPRPAGDRRSWLTFDGMFYQADVWLDGAYLGDTEGYFAPHTFDLTAQLASRDEHLVAVELACGPQRDKTAKRNLTGVFQHWDCIAPTWNPGGIWAPVRVWQTGPLRIGSLAVTCPEASPERAVLDLEAAIDSPQPLTATVESGVAREGGSAAGMARTEHSLASGTNRVRWQMTVESPELWWPRALGDQPLYQVTVTVSAAGTPSDQRVLVTGLRQARMRNFLMTVNGERLFVKGANLAPTDRALGAASPERVQGDVLAAVDAGLDLLRVHGHVGRPELYEAADRHGLLLWQDMPLQWAYRGVRRQAVRQARQAVDLLGHHPSVVVWCAHNEPVAHVAEPGKGMDRASAARFVRGQLLPSWNRTVLDRSIKRALQKSDASREVVAHSGVWPHPAGGTDSHLYFGWYHGRVADLAPTLARAPVMARWVGEFGAQAVPDTDDFLEPRRWPELDWDRLIAEHGLQKEIFDRRIPPSDFATFAEWRAATQRYQAELITHHVETVRRLKYRPAGGFCQFMLADSQPAVSWSVLDHRRVPKLGYQALAAACAPVIAVADRPRACYQSGQPMSLELHVVSDRRTPIAGARLSARLQWPGGSRHWRFVGDVEADCCCRVGRLEHTLPADCGEGPVVVDLRLTSPTEGTIATNRYRTRVARPT
jgi:beta-mannosidase